jgi:hypothetical protein
MMVARLWIGEEPSVLPCRDIGGFDHFAPLLGFLEEELAEA